MRKGPDLYTHDLFSRVPKPAPLEAGVMSLQVKIAHAMSEAMKACPLDRYEIAARMSRILGRDVSKHMLDAYAAPSRNTHIPNFELCIAFDAATDQHALLELFAAMRGCAVLVGEETLTAELGRLEQQENEIRQRRNALKSYLQRR